VKLVSGSSNKLDTDPTFSTKNPTFGCRMGAKRTSLLTILTILRIRRAFQHARGALQKAADCFKGRKPAGFTHCKEINGLPIRQRRPTGRASSA
jgi:hypothetical protein